MSRNFEVLTQVETDVGRVSRSAGATLDRPVVKEGGSSDVRGEEMLRMVQRIFLSANGSAPRHVVFCGVDVENGSNSVCASAGRILAASSSRSVCLVDANVSSQRLSCLFGVGTTPFPDQITSLRAQCTDLSSNLWLAGAKLLTDDRGALKSAQEIKQLLIELGGMFEYVLIDAPGANVSGDAALIGQVADAAVLVVEANRTRRLTARKAMQTLDASGVRLLGTVLHNREFPIPARLYKRL